jgi:stage II sporulation protein D
MEEPLVSIGILSEKEIRFDLYGEYTIRGVDKKFSGKYKAKIDGNKIKIVQESKEIHSAAAITLIPNDIEMESFLLRDVVIGKNFHWERKENQRFRGSLKIIKENDNLTAVNIIPIEEYLTSVISSEMSPNSSIELLKAHAIISRGWLLAQLDKKAKSVVNEKISEDEIIRWYNREDHANFDLCADDHCQRYQGVSKISNDNAIHAIDETRGLVLKHEDEICDTRYSKCCGGASESYENVWDDEPHPYLSAIFDYKFETDDEGEDLTKEKFAEEWIRRSPHAFCNTDDKKILSSVLVNFDQDTKNFYRWNVEYTQEELSQLIKSKSGIDFGDIVDLVPVERGKSGRITRLKIIGTNKTMIIGKELEIRKVLSQSHLYSSAFIVKKENIIKKIPGKFILYGAGWGHGVGLCQIGAAVMSEIGYRFDEILSHYFKGTSIQRIY